MPGLHDHEEYDHPQSPRGTTRRCTVSATLVPECGSWFGATPPLGQGDLITSTTALESEIGRPLAIVHTFHRWRDDFPTKSERALASSGHIMFLNWQATEPDGKGVPWASIARGTEDRQIDLVAARLRGLAGPFMLSFHHEPEADLRAAGSRNGSPTDFAAAWRHVHDRFAVDGVRQAIWVWTIMGVMGAHVSEQYRKLYPGSSYVDWVAWDPYNWGACRNESWRSFEQIVRPFYSLALQAWGSKPLMLAEYGTAEDAQQPTRKAQWFGQAASSLQHLDNLKALVYFDESPPYGRCRWSADTSSASLSAFRTFAQAPAFLAPSARASRSGSR